MTLYIKVTKDKYELPVAVADTVVELAKMVGTTEQSIYSSMSHAKVRGQNSPYKKVEIEE